MTLSFRQFEIYWNIVHWKKYFDKLILKENNMENNDILYIIDNGTAVGYAYTKSLMEVNSEEVNNEKRFQNIPSFKVFFSHLNQLIDHEPSIMENYEPYTFEIPPIYKSGWGFVYNVYDDTYYVIYKNSNATFPYIVDPVYFRENEENSPIIEYIKNLGKEYLEKPAIHFILEDLDKSPDEIEEILIKEGKM